MYSCIDSLNNYYTVNEYCLLKKELNHPKTIFCPFCENSVSIRAENSQEQTHFKHANNTSCSNKTYEYYFNTPGKRKTQEEIKELKHQIFLKCFYIYDKIYQHFHLILPISTFLSVLNKLVRKNRLLSLINITPEHMPFIIVNELGNFDDISYLYTNFRNSASLKLWNLTNKKDCVLCVKKDKNNKVERFVVTVNLDSYITSKIPINFITSIIPDIFESLQIYSHDEDLLIKELLKHV